MKIKIIDYGYENLPKRSHYNDAGADVYVMKEVVIDPHTSYKMPLGLGIKLPDGFAAFVCPRSGLSSKGIVCEMSPIDSGYTGEIHAIMTNNTDFAVRVNKGDRVGQLVIVPCILCDFITESDTMTERGASGFGSTGS